MWAATTWQQGEARSKPPTQNITQDLRHLKLPESQIKAMEASLQSRTSPSPDDGLWPAHVLPVQGFFACDTQWNTAAGGMGQPIFLGLDYAGCAVSLKAHGITLDQNQWKDFRTLEAAAASLLNGRKPEAS